MCCIGPGESRPPSRSVGSGDSAGRLDNELAAAHEHDLDRVLRIASEWRAVACRGVVQVGDHFDPLPARRHLYAGSRIDVEVQSNTPEPGALRNDQSVVVEATALQPPCGWVGSARSAEPGIRRN